MYVGWDGDDDDDEYLYYTGFLIDVYIQMTEDQQMVKDQPWVLATEYCPPFYTGRHLISITRNLKTHHNDETSKRK